MEPVNPQLVELLYRKADLIQMPIHGTFEISPVCNMDCHMCYVKMSKEEVARQGGLLSNRQWIELAGKAMDQGMLFLLLTGGEPFLREGFRELYQELAGMGLVLSVNTNGTLLTEETVEWLAQYPPSRVNITLYGASNETYQRLCRNPKGFTQVCQGIDRLLGAGIQVKLNASITPYNQGDVEKMVQFSNEKKLLMQATTYMFPPIRRDASMTGTNDRFTAEEAAYQSAKIQILQTSRKDFEEHYQKLSGETDRGCDIPSSCDTAGGYPMKCRAGGSSFWITWKGEMLPCGMMTIPVTYPLRSGFAEAWKGQVEEVKKIRLPETCGRCAKEHFCKTCAAMVLAEGGSFSEAPNYRCRMADAYLDCAREILEKGIR